MSSSTRSRQRGQPASNMDVSNIPPPPMFKPPPLPSDDDDVFVRTISRTRSPTPKLSLPGKSIESLTDKTENKSDLLQKPVISSMMLAGMKSCEEDINLSRIQPPQEVKIIVDTFEESNKIEENKVNTTIDILGGSTSPGSMQKCNSNQTPILTAQKVTKEKQQDFEPTTLPVESEVVISKCTFSEGQPNRQKSGSTEKFEDESGNNQVDKEDGENNQKHLFYEAFPPQKEIPLKTKFKRRNSKKKPIKCSEKFVIQQEKNDSDSVQISGKTNEEVPVLSVEEDIVLKEDNMTPKEKIIISEVLNSRRSRSRSSSRIGNSPIPQAESEVLPCIKNLILSVETKDEKNSDDNYCLLSKCTKENESQRLESESWIPKVKLRYEENNSLNKSEDNSDKSQQFIQSEENDGNITTIIANQGSISKITGRDLDCGIAEKDLADEIMTSCNDVNDILERIMNSASHEDEDISYSPDNFKLNEIDPQNKNTSDEKCTPDYFEMVENIADLTVDNIKEHLLKEQKDSNKVETFITEESENKMDDMEVSSYKHTDFSLLSQHDNEINIKENLDMNIVKTLTEKQENDSRRNDDFHTEIVASSSTFSNEASAASTNNKKPLYSSKKEQQLAKIQDFLKDPASEGKENINIPVRLKKSDVEKEEESMEINKLVNGLHISSFAALNQSNLVENSITSVVHISTKYCAVSKVENHHIKLATEDINSLENEFDTVADVVFRVREKDGETLIACEESVGVATVMCVAFLVKHEGMNLPAAVQLVQEKRPNVKMHQGLLVRLKEWEKLRHHGSPFDRISELLISWLPLMFAILISYLAIKTFLDNVDKQHSEDKMGDVKTLYDYFHVLKWP